MFLFLNLYRFGTPRQSLSKCLDFISRYLLQLFLRNNQLMICTPIGLPISSNEQCQWL